MFPENFISSRDFNAGRRSIFRIPPAAFDCFRRLVQAVLLSEPEPNEYVPPAAKPRSNRGHRGPLQPGESLASSPYAHDRIPYRYNSGYWLPSRCALCLCVVCDTLAYLRKCVPLRTSDEISKDSVASGLGNCSDRKCNDVSDARWNQTIV